MINVIVVEDNDTIREGLKILINETKGYFCSVTYPHYNLLIDNINKVSANVLLIDIGVPGFQGINAIKKIKTVLPDLTVLILTLYEENDLIFDALCAGANGYLVKRTPPDKLLQSIQEAYNGGMPMSSVIARKVLDFFRQKKQVNNDDKHNRLSNCEKDILNKLIEGNSFKAIADSLFMNVDEIRFSFKNIYKKLHLQARGK